MNNADRDPVLVGDIVAYENDDDDDVSKVQSAIEDNSHLTDPRIVSAQTPSDLDTFEEAEDVFSGTPCYVLHTSGSTGEAKPVLGTAAGLISRAKWMFPDTLLPAGSLR